MKILTKIIVFVTAFVFTTVADANEGDLFLTTPLGSYHFDRSNDWCEINPGAGVQYFVNDNTYVATGLYHNSHCKAAPYLMSGMETNTDRMIGVGFSTAIIGGYGESSYSTAPFIAFPYIRFGSNRNTVNARMMVLPYTDGVVGIALNWKIK